MRLPWSDDEGRALRFASRATARTLNQWPLLVVLAGLAVALGVVGLGHWRRGCVAAGVVVALAGMLRLVLPGRLAGLLAVRARWFDVVLLVGCGAAIVVVTLLVPPPVL